MGPEHCSCGMTCINVEAPTGVVRYIRTNFPLVCLKTTHR
jgi:hypothetical protein